MIETVRMIKWSEELDPRTWYRELQDKISNNEFRNAHSFMVNGISRELDAVVSAFNKVLEDEDNLSNFIEWVNARIKDQTNVRNRFHVPCDESYDMWLRINDKAICFRLSDEYMGRGMVDSDASVQYIDKDGTDDFWIGIFEALTKVANGEE